MERLGGEQGADTEWSGGAKQRRKCEAAGALLPHC